MSNRNTDDNWTIGNYETNRYRDVIDLDEEDYYEVEIFGDENIIQEKLIQIFLIDLQSALGPQKKINKEILSI